MKLIEWIDQDGYKHASLVRDNDSDADAQKGIPQDPPNVDNLDWEAIKRDLHNELFVLQLFTWNDVQRSQQGITSAILAAIKPRLIQLYRAKEEENVVT